jgi:predicted ATPase
VQRPLYTELAPEDMLVVLLDHSSLALVCSGFLDQARSRRGAALAEARRLSHAPTLAHALLWAWLLGLSARAEPAKLSQYADELLALSDEHGFPFFRAIGLVAHGWCLAASGQADQGISLLTTGLADVGATGTILAMPSLLTWLADAYRMAGQPQIALARLAEAERFAEATQVKSVQAETLRLRGDLLILTSDLVAAEASFRDAIALAGKQGAKLWELRASTSLARLWRDQGRHAEARDLIAPIYNWFTEGFDAPDLIEAKALLDELASN